MLRIKDTVYIGAAEPGTGGGGQTYSAGPGIEISGGGISLASDALAQVPQTLPSGGYVAKGVDNSGGYFYVGSTSATMGASGSYRIMAGGIAATVKTNTSTGLFLSGTSAMIKTDGAMRISCGGANTYIYGNTAAGGIRIYASGTSGTVKVRSNSGDYADIITESSYATSDTPGIVQPDNSTCTVISGGILSMVPPTTMWTSGNAGSEVTYSSLDGGTVQRVYKNGLLMQSGVDYDIQSGGVVSYATPVGSGDKVAFEYYPAPVQEPGRGGKGAKSGDDDGWKEEAEPEEKEPEKDGEER